MREKHRHLTRARIQKGYSQEQLAVALDVSRGTVAHIEQGIRNASSTMRNKWLIVCSSGLEQGNDGLLRQTVQHQVLLCGRCGATMYDDPPNSGLIVPCPCGPPLGTPRGVGGQ